MNIFFSESGEGHVVCIMKLEFRHEEMFVIEKCQSLITSGAIDGMPVDDRFFRVLGKYLDLHFVSGATPDNAYMAIQYFLNGCFSKII